jgi:alpha-tubulin suppressor-like RCC1 family protein
MFTFLSKLRLKFYFVFFVLLSATFTVNASLERQWLQVSAGSKYFLAIKSDGTLCTWVNNSSGKLGYGATTNRTTVVQIGSEA